jgi:hypothetical protein
MYISSCSSSSGHRIDWMPKRYTTSLALLPTTTYHHGRIVHLTWETGCCLTSPPLRRPAWLSCISALLAMLLFKKLFMQLAVTHKSLVRTLLFVVAHEYPSWGLLCRHSQQRYAVVTVREHSVSELPARFSGGVDFSRNQDLLCNDKKLHRYVILLVSFWAIPRRTCS